MRRDWRSTDGNNYYFFQTSNGKVVGQAYKIGYTILWGAKIPINATEEEILGQYIGVEFAKCAIEEYWNEKDRTLEVISEYLLPRS